MIAKNSIHEVTVTDVNNLGYGIARIDGMVVFVAGGVTGDKLKIKIIKTARDYLVARIEAVLEASPHRIEPECPAAKRCGGCSFAGVDYAYERELKRSFVSSAFRRAGLDAEVAECISDGRTHGYRNKVAYPIEGEKMGYYAAHSHDIIVPDGGCRLELPILHEIAGFVADEISRVPMQELRHLYMRAGEKTGQVMVCLVTRKASTPGILRLASLLASRFACIRSIVQNINTDDGNVILGKKFVTLYGDGYIEDVLCGLRFRLSAASFYQVNAPMAELLYSRAAELADLKEGQTLCDLYCGAGTIGLSIAAQTKGAILRGVEIVPEAIENAKYNARLNGITNAEFVAGDATANAPALIGGADVILVDPPRKGLTPELISELCASDAERIVYISCNPSTLARDCAIFRDHGWDYGTVTPFDLFPRTGHVESVVRLVRQK
ncbi:MAG: 23S rRNA (uracil(1939)-C(5))-methyltransferase RlmD [Clostridia bacterium]|nr:23S rRNA (uracil(1939)-C(5))-methyltransferase RlmD [Clostridia bacterium]